MLPAGGTGLFKYPKQIIEYSCFRNTNFVLPQPHFFAKMNILLPFIIITDNIIYNDNKGAEHN